MPGPFANARGLRQEIPSGITNSRLGGGKVWGFQQSTGHGRFRIARQFKYRGNYQCRGREPRARRRE